MKRRAPLADINITPLVDVLLVLVAMLLLLAPQLVKVLPADLPQLSIEGAPRQQRSLLVVMDERGHLSIDAQPMSIEDVADRIVPSITTVELAASGRVSYQQIVDTVAELRKKNPREVQMIMR